MVAETMKFPKTMSGQTQSPLPPRTLEEKVQASQQ